MRARDVKTGDTLPDGRQVVRVSSTDRGVYIVVRSEENGPTTRLRYQPDTIMPEAGQRHPSRHENGHPWSRYRAASKVGWTTIPKV
jgi:hypothetical protein